MTNQNAELTMRVKALEIDVADLQRRLTGMTGATEILIEQVRELRQRAGLQ